MKTKTLNRNFKSFFTFVILACFLFVGQTLYAQQSNKTPEEQAQALTEKMKYSLMLNDQQSTDIYNINLKYINKNKDLKNSSARPKSKMQTLKSNQQAKDKEIQSVLSNNQYKEYQKMKDESMDELKQRKNNRR